MFALVPVISFLVTLFLILEKTQHRLRRRISGQVYDLFLVVVQISPLVIGVVFYSQTWASFGVTLDNGVVSLSLGALVGLVSMFIEYFLLDVKVLISDEMLVMLPRIEFRHLIRRVMGGLILFPISEEILYRGALQTVLSYYIQYFSLVPTTLLFMGQHFVDPLARRHYRSWKNRVFLFFEGIALGLILYLTGSLLGCVIAHIMMNFLSALPRIKKYLYFNQPT